MPGADKVAKKTPLFRWTTGHNTRRGFRWTKSKTGVLLNSGLFLVTFSHTGIQGANMKFESCLRLVSIDCPWMHNRNTITVCSYVRFCTIIHKLAGLATETRTPSYKQAITRLSYLKCYSLESLQLYTNPAGPMAEQ